MVASLYFVYKAMEEAFDQTASVRVRALDMRCLRRVPALEAGAAGKEGAEALCFLGVGDQGRTSP